MMDYLDHLCDPAELLLCSSEIKLKVNSSCLNRLMTQAGDSAANEHKKSIVLKKTNHFLFRSHLASSMLVE